MNNPTPSRKPLRFIAPLLTLLLASAALAQETRIPLNAKMVINEAAWGNPEAMVDEQDAIGDPPANEARNPWAVDFRKDRTYPTSAYLDLGKDRPLSALWLYDINASGDLELSSGSPGKWEKLTTCKTDAYKKWVSVPLNVTTRYLRITRMDRGGQFTEIALYEYTPQAWKAHQDKKQADARDADERRLALAKAQEEVKNRPMIDVGEPFGKLALVDEIDCAADKPDHLFAEFPAGVSRIEEILGRKCRTLALQADQSSYVSWRIGRHKLLKPGAAYLVTVEYPEDAPRSLVIMNGGCETSRGFHTGQSAGDAVRSKYIWSNPESLKIPLSNKWETWQQFFHLHDRFPERAFIRGAGLRALAPDDGFPVTIAQFSAENDPPSRGIAVKRIRLFEVAKPRAMDVKLALLPPGLPARRIFWREEMADGVIDSAKPEECGLAKSLDWYQHKASLMHFLGINTYTKDLLEFGACQHWDSSPGGGHNWVFFAERHKTLWGKIVELMGREGFALLPYYEYAGSRGYKGLGHQRRCKPLTRDDAYTHIKWIEQANADITDPETHADFAKILDLTVVKFKDQAKFAGVWIRPRCQIPISFGPGALERFAAQANNAQTVTRQDLQKDKALLARYYDWWYGQRRAFLEAMRDHLRKSGVNPDAFVLYTADASEAGASFPTWDKRVVTDDAASWTKWLEAGNIGKDKPIKPIGSDEVINQDDYFKALTSAPLDWGKWEWKHASPPADPQRYRDVPGVMLTHGINRAYSVASPNTLDAFRTAAGLTVVRHYSLNENMMCDKAGKDILGYFVADIERAGPYCMLAEARAVANGDPHYLGYLVGNSLNRGFPRYVREFNAAFLAMPALPSKRIDGAAGDPEIVVRLISTPNHGAWIAIVNTGLAAKDATKIKLPFPGKTTDAVTGAPIEQQAGAVTMTLAPCQLRVLRVQ